VVELVVAGSLVVVELVADGRWVGHDADGHLGGSQGRRPSGRISRQAAVWVDLDRVELEAACGRQVGARGGGVGVERRGGGVGVEQCGSGVGVELRGGGGIRVELRQWWRYRPSGRMTPS
jgi:hypothetical protein